MQHKNMQNNFQLSEEKRIMLMFIIMLIVLLILNIVISLKLTSNFHMNLFFCFLRGLLTESASFKSLYAIQHTVAYNSIRVCRRDLCG